MFIFKLAKIKFKIGTLIIVFLSLIFVGNQIIEVSQSNLPTPLEQVTTEEKVIALTINVDWGEEYIPKILAILNENKAKVTFFVTGRWARKNPELLKYMASQGHQIENHGYYHSHPDKLSVAKNKEELVMTEKAIVELIGRKTMYYAPPYGERGRNGLIAAEELDYITVLWTLDTIDWRSDSTPELIVQRILEPKIRYGIKPERKGAIVLMHPKENTVIALPKVLSRLRGEGYEVVTLEKLITFGLLGNTTP
jgi:peptidoglycan/xylan/chitin deacetylase (PgdA/CDA1 family)